MLPRTDTDATTGTAVTRIDHRVGQEVVWTVGEVERLVYRYATDRHKPYIHPLRSVRGAMLTALEPADHPWHRGVWFAWKFLNGINFWEETGHAGKDMAAYGADTRYGHTEFAGIDEVTQQPDVTHIVTRYAYRAAGEKALLDEQRTLAVGFLPDGCCAIDWDSSFTAGEAPVRFDRTVISPETPWGGYAGLSFRAAQGWRDVHGLDSEGRRDEEIEHQRARWVQVSGRADDGEPGTVVMFDHPENPRYPSHWRYIDDPGFTYINPSLVLAEPFDLAPGATLRLRYRLLARDTPLDGAALDAWHAAFAAGRWGSDAPDSKHSRPGQTEKGDGDDE